MPSISASVGIAKGKQCYNVVADQLTIINMLNSLPGYSGGTADNPLDTSPRWGICSNALYQAILNFQGRYSLSQDGHIDPGGKAIRTLNAALGDQLPAAGPDVGPAASGAVGVDDTLWLVESLDLSNAGAVGGLGVNAYWGSIDIFNNLAGSLTYPMKGGGVAAGASASMGPPTPAPSPGSATPLARKALQWLIENGGYAGTGPLFPSGSAGICVPLGSTLERSAFVGSCYGGNVNLGAGFPGANVWALFFGMPKSYVTGLIATDFMEGTILLTPEAIIALGCMLYQARGVALVAGAGLTFTVSAGVSVNQFIGVIG